jgi:hypothetical protein
VTREVITMPDRSRASLTADRAQAALTADPPAGGDVPGSWALASWLHPVYAELFEPEDLLVEGGVRLEPLGEASLLKRRALRVRAVVDWTPDRHLAAVENLPPADDHELLVHVERGVILRRRSFADDRVFSSTEITSLVFDEELPPELFAQPRS